MSTAWQRKSLRGRLQRKGLQLLAVTLALQGCSRQDTAVVSGPAPTEDGRPDVPPADSSPPSPPPPPPPPPAFQPARLTLRTLLGWQYRNAITDLLGAEAGNAVQPPPDTAINGFDAIGSAQLALSSSAITAYERSAQLAAKAAFTSTAGRAALVGCTPRSTADTECLRTFLRGFGERAWRRPLTASELEAWTAVGSQAATAYQDFYKGAELAVAGLLQSPAFLYLVEVGTPDPARPGQLRLSGHEVASRLAFFLTGTTPDAALLAAAGRGELDTDDGLRAQARRLLQQPSARAALGAFFDELLRLRELPALSKDSATFPTFTPSLATAMREESLRLIEDIVWTRQGDFRDVFTADYTFVNPELAVHYGLPGVSGAGYTRVTLPVETGRGGLLGHASLLSLLAHPTSTSPTLRGKFVRERLLCQPLAPPPTDVDTSLPAPVPGEGPQTMRQRLQRHVTAPSCAGCHRRMDPIGLGLEHFDGVGRFQARDQGLPIDPVSTFDWLGSFDSPRSLGHLLREDERALTCLVRTLFRMATGHVDEEGESAPLLRLDAAFAASGYRLQDLLVELVASEAFRYARPQEVQP